APNRAEDFLRQHPFVDICCRGEGEQVFLRILETYPSRDWSGIPSISFLDQDRRFTANPLVDRLKDLNVLPSPYLEGTFEPLMQANPQVQWLALWETNRGCPFHCTFCEWGAAIQTKLTQFDMERLTREVEWFAEKKIEFIFCCDANFGILHRDLDIAQHVAETKRKRGYPRALSVQGTKNATERAYRVQKILADAGLNKGVAIALQSLDPTTLKNIRRQNISTETYQELQRRFARDRVETFTDIILGLPGETYDSFVEGVSKIIADGQHNRIQFINLAILPNAEMGDPTYQRKFGMVIVETQIINIHGSLAESKDDVHETQQLVVATNTMPPADWVRTRTFSWMTALLHFDKLLQIPLVLLHEVTGLSYRDLLEAFSKGDLAAFPILSETRDFFDEQARNIQAGGPEYTRSEECLNIWWPTDEYVFIQLARKGRLEAFYQEAESLLARLLREKFVEVEPELLRDAVTLNKSLLKQPFQTEDLELALSYNIWEFYRGVLEGASVPLEEKQSCYLIDRTREKWTTWDDWCREVVWYGNKRGAYLYNARPVARETPGR
ncbi:MAG: radical SAM protein, partial [Verrucomicrobiae bacterium]|nr:radical SAM protein [Verrucomicrobiae bacterium]